VPTGFVAPAWVPGAGFVSCAALGDPRHGADGL